MGKHRLPNYSRGVRQRLYKLSVDNKWREKHNVQIGDGRDIQGEYTQLLSRSKFCLVAPGDGWSARVEDAALHGCVPVVIMDGVHAVGCEGGRSVRCRSDCGGLCVAGF